MFHVLPLLMVWQVLVGPDSVCRGSMSVCAQSSVLCTVCSIMSVTIVVLTGRFYWDDMLTVVVFCILSCVIHV